ncbi:solute carrier family 41 member 1-like [Varroa destructor]|uniref:SLC41A/MgtE integral membrane domain-containing protein n=1 Tax=Varroa destructor TaxID=109461 RepID=A0A7M7M5K2_VARDE|nr:solute carrier family 41 member 1-like [Varroa destructor]
MFFNNGYSPTASKRNVKAGHENVVECGVISQGKYRSLSQSSPFELYGISSTDPSIGSSESPAIIINEKVAINDSDPKASVKKEPGNENQLTSLIQIIGPFLVAGVGSMCTGILLDKVKTWQNFKSIESLISLVPTLLGLKGNLELTVIARLCTASNIGKLDEPKALLTVFRDNLLLTQFQATIVSCLASLLTLGIQIIKDSSKLNWVNATVVTSSAVVTAAVACLFLELFMIGVLAISRKLRINPDNVVAPLASSIGDISTLALFACISNLMFALKDHIYFLIATKCLLIIICPIWGYLGCQSSDVRVHLQQSWLPILLALCISVGAGYTLDKAAQSLVVAPAYIPVVSGICGNLIVILICRMTTVLWQESELGKDDGTISAMRSDNPFRCRGNTYKNLTGTFQLLLILPIVAHSIFLPVISSVVKGATLTVVYAVIFLSMTFVHALIMLFITRETVLQLWRRGIDPDIASIPILTAVADLTGGAFTCVIFATLYTLKDSSVLHKQEGL